MTAPDIDLDALEAAALAAMPIETDLYGDRYLCGSYSRADLTAEQDKYIAASNPAVVLELIRRLRAAEKLQAALVPEWDEVGEARTLAAAAYDADEWMALIQRLNDSGRGPWKFSDPESAEKLRGCRKALKRLLPIDENGRPKEQ